MGKQVENNPLEQLTFDNQKAYLSMSFKDPTSLSTVLSYISEHLNLTIVLDPLNDQTIQIFSPNKLTQQEAFHLFIATLETLGLRVISMGERIIKITKKRTRFEAI